MGVVRSQLPGYVDRLWATPIKRIVAWSAFQTALGEFASTGSVALDVHRHALLQWLRRDGHRVAFIDWLEEVPGLEESACEETAASAWLNANLLDRIETAEVFAEDFLAGEADLSKKDAYASVFELMSLLVPLHPDAPAGASALAIEVQEAQRVGGPLQLIIRSGAVNATSGVSFEDAPEVLEALQAVKLPDTGIPSPEANDPLHVFYGSLARTLETTPEGARNELRDGYRRYKKNFETRKRRNEKKGLALSVAELERPRYLKVPKGQCSEEVLELLMNDLDGAVYEEAHGMDDDQILGALTTTLVKLAKGMNA